MREESQALVPLKETRDGVGVIHSLIPRALARIGMKKRWQCVCRVALWGGWFKGSPISKDLFGGSRFESYPDGFKVGDTCGPLLTCTFVYESFLEDPPK